MLFTDDFNRADTNPIGGNWNTVASFTNLQIVSNQVRLTAANAQGHAIYNLISAADCRSTIQCITANSSCQLRALARCTLNSSSGYMSYISTVGSSGTAILAKINPYVEIGNTSSITVASGDTISVDCHGSTIKFFHNNTQIYSVTDTDHLSGYMGIGILVPAAVATSQGILDNWVGYTETQLSQFQFWM